MDGEPEILAIIPARGGSKNIPGKNIKPLCGKPLIVYAIEAAKRSSHIGRIVVSTDDEAIAAVARLHHVETPFLRPADLATDAATDLPVFQHCLQWLADNEDYRPEIVVHLRPTAPLRRTEHIDAAIELMLQSPHVDAVRSVCPANDHPLKTWSIRNGALLPFVPQEVYRIDEPYNRPRQSLPKVYVQNGSVDVIRAKVIRDQNSMTGHRILAYVMDEMESVNLDTPLNWELAEVLMSRRLRQKAA